MELSYLGGRMNRTLRFNQWRDAILFLDQGTEKILHHSYTEKLRVRR